MIFFYIICLFLQYMLQMKLYLHYINAVFVAAWHFLEKRECQMANIFMLTCVLVTTCIVTFPYPLFVKIAFTLSHYPPHESFG